jgi:hypothetical protein
MGQGAVWAWGRVDVGRGAWGRAGLLDSQIFIVEDSRSLGPQWERGAEDEDEDDSRNERTRDRLGQRNDREP